jgi:ATP-dependent DNA helicase RecQ
MPTGIEVYMYSLDNINENDIRSHDKKIYDEFEQTRKLRELKLISLQVLSGIDKSKQDSFIKKYFACNSLEALLKLLEEELPADSSILKAFRAEAIKKAEDGLNKEQREVYDSEVNQHINVIAGPGSGKTHTLTLRVARLVHHIGTPPEEILVLAYNRAVVSELKERLSTLFGNLGYESLARRLKIFTFHGLAKKYCYEEVKGEPFEKWENILLQKLNHSPGSIMNHIGNIKHILVDEFQDINNVRVDLLNKLNELTNAYIFIIGDPNQSIYGFERIHDHGSMSPWPYYNDFDTIFNPKEFPLYDNHRSYPEILKLSSTLLALPEKHKHLLPRSTRQPDEKFITNYVEVFENPTSFTSNWFDKINPLLH